MSDSDGTTIDEQLKAEVIRHAKGIDFPEVEKAIAMHNVVFALCRVDQLKEQAAVFYVIGFGLRLMSQCYDPDRRKTVIVQDYTRDPEMICNALDQWIAEALERCKTSE